MGSMMSWMFDKQVQVNVCLTGQFALLMLVEELELAGIHVFSFNTDGLTLKLDRTKEELFKTICSDWEKKTEFVLERQDYKKIIYSTVNDYIAITEEGKVKTKGDFISEFELWKNKSNRIVGLALQEYFTKGTNPEEFIRCHKNIFDFCIMARATGDLHLEEQSVENSEIKVVKHKKLIRYYLSKTSKSQLFKRGTGSTGKPANINMNAANELGEIYIQYYNQHKDLKNFEDYNVDYNQYIYKVYKIIAKVERNKKHLGFADKCNNVGQLSLF